MGESASSGSESTDREGADLRQRQVFASNSGVCVEPRHPGVSLNLGAGRCVWPDWINDTTSDFLHLPYGDNTIDRIAGIHVLEHVYEWEAAPMLTEWKRTLKPGGQLILELPCMDKVMHYLAIAIQKGEPLAGFMSWWPLWGDPKHQDPRMTHKWGYTKQMLMDLLAAVGFEAITMNKPQYHFPMRDMRVEAIKGGI